MSVNAVMFFLINKATPPPLLSPLISCLYTCTLGHPSTLSLHGRCAHLTITSVYLTLILPDNLEVFQLQLQFVHMVRSYSWTIFPRIYSSGSLEVSLTSHIRQEHASSPICHSYCTKTKEMSHKKKQTTPFSQPPCQNITSFSTYLQPSTCISTQLLPIGHSDSACLLYRHP